MMKISISENIRNLRKGCKLTQEQLAEALGVTVGAVSKWESAMSVPDISTIIGLADFFDTSVDALLGYDLPKGGVEKTKETLRTMRQKKQFAEGMREAEKALKKYPNLFDIVYECAMLYAVGGRERKSIKECHRGIELSEQALEMLGQNTNPHIGDIGIRREMANLYIAIGEAETGIAILRKSNIRGINDAVIGYALASISHKPEEALPFLSRAMIDTVLNQMQELSIGFSNAYLDMGQQEEAVYSMEWYADMLQGLRLPGESSFLDKLEAICLCRVVTLSMKQGSRDRALRALRRAVLLAQRFDENPKYQMSGIRFFHGSGTETAYDDFGTSTLDGLYGQLISNPDTRAEMESLWEEALKQ
jgi:transcriptional regulator with XRE-family HTH domain